MSSMRQAGLNQNPAIGYVFLGKLMETEILTRIPDRYAPEIMVETALTVAAVQIAAVGVGIAWIPRSMLDNLPARDDLTVFSDLLPTSVIATTATRLIGRKSDAEDRIWAELAAGQLMA